MEAYLESSSSKIQNYADMVDGVLKRYSKEIRDLDFVVYTNDHQKVGTLSLDGVFDDIWKMFKLGNNYKLSFSFDEALDNLSWEELLSPS